MTDSELALLKEPVDVGLALEAENAVVGVPNDQDVPLRVPFSPALRPQVEG